MKKKYYAVILAGIMLFGALAGCTANTSASSGEIPVVSELDQNIAKYEELISTEPTAENYAALAGLYQEAGKIKRQRDILEQSYRLYKDETSFETLQGIVVNAAEESALVQDELKRLAQNISVADYQKEAVGQLVSPDWMTTAMPKMKKGHRSYYWEDDTAKAVLYVEVGYDAENKNVPYTKAWYVTNEDQQVTVLLQEGTMVQMMTTGLTDGQYNGPFASWLCDSSTGTIYQDAGTLKNGVITGDYTSSVAATGQETDLFTLFSTREQMDFTAYSGNFADNGVTTVDQPSSSDGSYIVYAYNEEKSNYLLFNMAEEDNSENYVFDIHFLGVEAYPSFDSYTPVADALQGKMIVDLDQVQIRVNDSNVEWFDGTKWHVMGNVDDYIKDDPFNSIEEEAQPEEETEEEQASYGQLDSLMRRGTAKSYTGGSTSGGSSQGGKGSSSSSTKPSTPAPTNPSPTNPTPTPTPTPPSSSSTAPAPPPPGTGDGEDIEWTDDIL